MPFSITNAAFEGLRLIRREPMAVLMWGVTYFVGLGLILLLAGSAVVAAVQSVGAADPDPAAAMRAFGAVAMVYLIAIPLMVAVSSVIVAATCRAVLTPKARGFFYMKLGGAEFRLMAAYLLIALIFIAASMLFALLIAVFVGGFVMAAGDMGENASPPAAVALIYPLYFAFLGFLLWVSARLSMVGPITVAEGRFALGRSWLATKGRVWSLIDLGAATMVRSLIVYAVAIVLFVVLFMVFVSGFGSTLSTLETSPPSQVIGLILPFAIGGVMLLAAYSAIQFAVVSAPFVAFYRDVVATKVAAAPVSEA